jgi:hypothetical protein
LIFDGGGRKIKNLHIKGPSSFSEVFLTFGGFPTGLVDLFDVEGLFHFYDLRVGFFFPSLFLPQHRFSFGEISDNLQDRNFKLHRQLFGKKERERSRSIIALDVVSEKLCGVCQKIERGGKEKKE